MLLLRTLSSFSTGCNAAKSIPSKGEGDEGEGKVDEMGAKSLSCLKWPLEKNASMPPCLIQAAT